MGNQKTSDVESKKSEKLIEVQPKIYPQWRKQKWQWFRCKTKTQPISPTESRAKLKLELNPSAMGGKETASLFDLNPKISRCERPKDRKTKTHFLLQRRKTKTKIHLQRQKIKTKYLPIQACFKGKWWRFDQSLKFLIKNWKTTVDQSKHKQVFLRRFQTKSKKTIKLIQAKGGSQIFWEFWEIVATATHLWGCVGTT